MPVQRLIDESLLDAVTTKGGEGVITAMRMADTAAPGSSD